ncbi:hypothetical protein D3C86_1651560 [compost metagenome]
MKLSPAANRVWPRVVPMEPAFSTSVPIRTTKPPPSTTVAGLVVLICAPASTFTAPPALVKDGIRIGGSHQLGLGVSVA